MVSPVTKVSNQHGIEKDKKSEKTKTHSSDVKTSSNLIGAGYKNVNIGSKYIFGEDLSLHLDIDWNPKQTNKWNLVGDSKTYTSCNLNGDSCKTVVRDTMELQYSPGKNSAIGIGIFSNRVYSADSTKQYYGVSPTTLFGTTISSPYESTTIGPCFSISIKLGPDSSTNSE